MLTAAWFSPRRVFRPPHPGPRPLRRRWRRSPMAASFVPRRAERRRPTRADGQRTSFRHHPGLGVRRRRAARPRAARSAGSAPAVARGRRLGRGRPRSSYATLALDAGSADAGRRRALAARARRRRCCSPPGRAPRRPLPTRALTHAGPVALRRAHLLRLVRLALARAGVRRGRARPALGGRGGGRHDRLAGARARHAPLDRGAPATLEDAPAPAARDPGRGDRRPGRRRAVGRRAVGGGRIAARAVRGPGRGRRPARAHRAHPGVGDGAAPAPRGRGGRSRQAVSTTAASSRSAGRARRAASTAPGGRARPSCCSATRTRCSCSPRSSTSRCAVAGGS